MRIWVSCVLMFATFVIAIKEIIRMIKTKSVTKKDIIKVCFFLALWLCIRTNSNMVTRLEDNNESLQKQVEYANREKKSLNGKIDNKQEELEKTIKEKDEEIERITKEKDEEISEKTTFLEENGICTSCGEKEKKDKCVNEECVEYEEEEESTASSYSSDKLSSQAIPTTTDKYDNEEGYVYVNGGKSKSKIYHGSSTAHNMEGAVKMTREQAERQGYRPCGRNGCI